MSVSIDSYETTYNCSKTPAYNIKETQFGDGYIQTALDGINYDREEWSIEFEPLTTAAANTLEGILLNSVNGTANVLSWTPMGEASAKKWTAHQVNKRPNSTTTWSITCSFRREFPLS